MLDLFIVFLSTLSLRRATRTGLICGGGEIFLSTLSLRRATLLTMFIFCSMIFLSTLSLRRATRFRCWSIPRDRNFYPRSPCGERLCAFMSLFGVFLFLSTLSLRRATTPSSGTFRNTPKFLSTLSLRRATGLPVAGRIARRISIHALLAESDSQQRIE